MSERRIGLVGCGQWGQLIRRELRELDVEVIVADPEPSASLLEADGEGVHRELEALPTDLDAIIVATPASTHTDLARRALSHIDGPVYVEKPFTTSGTEARALHHEASNRIRILHTWRHHPGIDLLRVIARGGAIGEPTLLATRRCNWTSPRTDVDSLWTLVPHDLSIALHLLGSVPAPSAAQLERRAEHVVGGHVLGMTEAGVDFSVQFSTRSADKIREVRVHGTEGVAVFAGDDAKTITIASGCDLQPVIEHRPVAAGSAMHRQMRACLEHLDGGPPPGSGTAEAVAIVETVEQIRAISSPPNR